MRAHVADREMILECIELGVDVIDHGDEIDDEIIEKMVEAGTFWVPSLVYLWSLFEVGYAKRFGVTRASCTSTSARCCPKAQAAGVRILVGRRLQRRVPHPARGRPARPPGGQLRPRVRVLRRDRRTVAGRRPELGHRNAGQLLVDLPAKVGVVEPGALADLIVVDGDPLADLSLLARPEGALKAVIRDGAFVIDRLPPRSRRVAA